MTRARILDVPPRTLLERRLGVIVAMCGGQDAPTAQRMLFWRWLAEMRGEWGTREVPDDC